MASTPILPLAVWQSGTNQNSIPANDNALRIEALNREIISQAVTAQPASPADGDTYIIAATHTGAQWVGFTPQDISIFKSGTWYAWAPTEGLIVNIAGAQFKYDGGAWVLAGGGGGSSAWADLSGVPTPIEDIAALTDPGADRLLFWDDSGGIYTHLQLGTNLSITGTTLDATGGGAVSSVNGQAGSVSLSLDDLSDVSAASPTTGDVMTWDGTDWVAAPAGGGGGGLTGFTGTLNTTIPNNTVNASVLTPSGGTSDQDAVLTPKGAGGFMLGPAPDGTATGGNKRGTKTADLQYMRTTAGQVASGAYAFQHGTGNTTSGQSASSMGDTNTSSGDSSHAHGKLCVADANFSEAVGNGASVRGLIGASAHSSLRFAVAGDNQQLRLPVSWLTDSATPRPLTSNQAAPSTNNQLVIPDSGVYAFEAKVSARQSGADVVKGWIITGLVKRTGSTVTIVGTPTISVLGADAGASAWTLTVAVDSTNKAVQLVGTGTSSTYIYWTGYFTGAYLVGP